MLFVEIVKDHTVLWYAKLTWYSPRATHWICIYGLEYGLGSHGFRPAWLCLIIEVVVSREKCSSTIWLLYCDRLCFLLSPNKYFWLLRRHYGPIRTREVPQLNHVTFSSVQFLNHTHEGKQCTSCQRINYHNTTNHSRYLSRIELFRSC